MTGSSNGRVIVEYDPAQKNVVFNQPQNALGFKTADLQLRIADEGISVESLKGKLLMSLLQQVALQARQSQ